MELEKLLRQLMDEGGSDLHLLAGLAPAFRVDGTLQPRPGLGKCMPDDLETMVNAIIGKDQRERFEGSQTERYELDFSHGISGLGRFRMNLYRQRGTLALAIRAVPDRVPPLEELGLPQSVAGFTQLNAGLVLVTGATGSGKSTTLASMIDQINRTRPAHIITVEEPIEYLHEPKQSYISQREVGDYGDTLSYANALKFALRQDPDVILVGELRDYETISIALTAAETGHLVFGTLHTTGAAQTVSRVVDVFPADQQAQAAAQLSSTLRGVVSQVLLASADEAGRVPAAEVLKVNSGVASLIRERQVAGIYQSIETGAREGMTTIDQSLIDLIARRQVAPQHAWPHLRTDSARRKVQSYGLGPHTAFAA